MHNRFKINEELSVSNIVTNMCNEVAAQLVDKVKNDNAKIVQDKAMLMYKGIMNYDCSRYLKTIKNLNVIYVIYLLKNEEEFQLMDRNGFFNSSADYNNRNIKVSLAYTNGHPCKEFKSIIRHELKHIYEYDCGMQKNENFYNRVIFNYKHGLQWERTVAWALYLSFKTEQDAFLEQYYEYLKTDRHYTIDPMEDPQNPYCKFDDAFNEVTYIQINNEKLKASFGITKKQLYYILNSAEERLFKKMNHIWQKYNNDVAFDNGSINPNAASFMLECFNRGIEEIETDATF